MNMKSKIIIEKRIEAATILLMFLMILKILCLGTAYASDEERQGINIAVIDSGLMESHPAIDYSRILEGKSYVENVDSWADKIGHGTAVTGIIMKHTKDALIRPLMYYTKYPSGVPRNGGISGICDGIYDAIDEYGCKVICISSGIYCKDDMLKEAVEYAESKGVIIISAVGNDNIIDSSRIYYPAAYPTVIGIGAIDENENIADFSQRNDSVMAVMQGVYIEVPCIRNGTPFKIVSGTSYAAAAFCGVVAEMIKERPDITPEELRELVRLSCSDLGEEGYDIDYGYGTIR